MCSYFACRSVCVFSLGITCPSARVILGFDICDLISCCLRLKIINTSHTQLHLICVHHIYSTNPLHEMSHIRTQIRAHKFTHLHNGAIRAVRLLGEGVGGDLGWWVGLVSLGEGVGGDSGYIHLPHPRTPTCFCPHNGARYFF